MSHPPELRFLSENECPNSGPDWLFGTDCQPGTLTVWGYCGTCWTTPRRIPKVWLDRIDTEKGTV